MSESIFTIDSAASEEQRSVLEAFAIDVQTSPELVRDSLEVYLAQASYHDDSRGRLHQVDSFIKFLNDNPGSLEIINHLRVIFSERLDMQYMDFGKDRETEIDNHPRIATLIRAFKANQSSEGFRTQRRRLRLLEGLGLTALDSASDFPDLP